MEEWVNRKRKGPEVNPGACIRFSSVTTRCYLGGEEKVRREEGGAVIYSEAGKSIRRDQSAIRPWALSLASRRITLLYNAWICAWVVEL